MNEAHEELCSSATALQFGDETFSSAASFTMLHHVPTRELQDLPPRRGGAGPETGGVFIGSDSLDSPGLRAFHEGDTCNPVAAEEMPQRLQASGLRVVNVNAGWIAQEGDAEVYGTVFIVARKPGRDEE